MSEEQRANNQLTRYDAIVIGTGGIGGAALYHLAKRGVRVLGLDRFEPGHDRGSSHGQTRIIRQAYFEHLDYVPLLLRAYALWDGLSAEIEQPLYHQVGLIEVGPADGIVVPGVLAAAAEHDLPVERLTPSEVARRFVGMHVPEGCSAVFEPRAGYLAVERCVAAHVEAATRHGATLETGVEVLDWQADGSGFLVKTDRGDRRADRLVVTAGPWASELLADLDVSLEVVRKPIFWYASDDGRHEASAGFPCYFFELPDGMYYGSPQIDARGVKVGRHDGGDRVADPLLVDRSMWRQDEEDVQQFVRRFLPGVSDRRSEHTVCMYTKTRDEHFIVDRHPAHRHVVFAAGMSGHGFKFAPVLGEALAALALDGATDLPIGFLSLDRLLRA